MAKIKTKALARHRRLILDRGVRWAVQIAFFIAFPAVFSAAFNGVKYAFTQIGAMQPIELSAFIVTLAAVLAFTVVFGRFFCGYACAFGTLGDALFALFSPVRKKLGIGVRKPLLPPKLQRAMQLLKYLVLVAICGLCVAGSWSSISGYSPWTAFAGIIAGNVDGVAMGAFAILCTIALGMLFVERFFCQFLCPLGAVFSLLPMLPFSAFRRDTARCAKGCGLCKRSCPVSVHPDPDALATGECISCGRCADGCPLENVAMLRVPNPNATAMSELAEAPGAKKAQVKKYLVRLRGTEIPLVLVKAAALFALCWLFV